MIKKGTNTGKTTIRVDYKRSKNYNIKIKIVKMNQDQISKTKTTVQVSEVTKIHIKCSQNNRKKVSIKFQEKTGDPVET